MVFLAIILFLTANYSFTSGKHITTITFTQCEKYSINCVSEHVRFVDRIYSMLTNRHIAVAQSLKCTQVNEDPEKEYHYFFSVTPSDIKLIIRPSNQEVIVNIYDDSDEKEYISIALVGQYFFGSDDCIIEKQSGTLE